MRILESILETQEIRGLLAPPPQSAGSTAPGWLEEEDGLGCVESDQTMAVSVLGS